MTRNNQSVGIFDSGLGGLSVWREIASQFPEESTVYLADQAHVPYGPRSVTEIEEYAHGITRFLLQLGAKAIVVACNTASGAALHSLRASFPQIPFVGMEPAVKPATKRTHTGRIGVIATPTTFQGNLYKRLVVRFGDEAEIHTQVCPGLVEAIEAGRISDNTTEALIRCCLTPLLESGIDELVLGCTHYPFVRHVIEEIAGPGVEIIDPAPAIARQVGRVLRSRDLSASPDSPAHHRFYTTGDANAMARSIRMLVDHHCAPTSCLWEDDTISERANSTQMI